MSSSVGSRRDPAKLLPAGDRRRLAFGAGAVALALLTVWVQFSHLTGWPDGFYLDESFNAYNAWTLADRGVDEYGTPWPIVIRYPDGDSKSALYTYLLAGVFKITGPSVEAARALSATAGAAVVLLLAALAWRATRRPEITLLTGATALLTPWTFEVSRLVFDAALVPPLVAAFLLALHARPPSRDNPWPSVLLLAGLLAAITYSYHLGRLLGPLLAFGLLVYLRRDTWRSIVATWLLFAVLLMPYVAFELAHPGALTSRLNETGYLTGSLPDIAARFAHQFLGNIDPVRILLVGDSNERHHAPGIMGSVFVATAALALVGIDRSAHAAVRDPWSRFLLYGLAAAFVPASLTVDPFHSMRLSAVPVFIIALTIPGQVWLLERAAQVAWRRAAFAVIVGATLLQAAYFHARYAEVAPTRGAWFDEAYAGLLDTALATGKTPIYLVDGVVPGYIHGLWFGMLRGQPPDRFVHLGPGERPPSGAIVLSSEDKCSPCEELASGGFFRLYLVP
jgi:4-amino-4-deoxy-L-arabinose transferase-like glycosyltransferase